MLGAGQNRLIPMPGQGVDQVLSVVVQTKSTMGQAQHAVAVGIGPGEQGRTAGGTGRAGAEGVAEEDSLIGQAGQMGCSDGMPVGLDISTRVMGMQIQDIGSILHIRGDATENHSRWPGL